MICDLCLDGLHTCTNPHCNCPVCDRRRPQAVLLDDEDLPLGVLLLLRRLHDGLREERRAS